MKKGDDQGPRSGVAGLKSSLQGEIDLLDYIIEKDSQCEWAIDRRTEALTRFKALAGEK